MDIVINDNSIEPIYEQIQQQIIKAIIKGDLVEGDQLPSLRSLAKELRVSVLSVNRAYTELEKNGFIYSIHGSGFFVGDTESKIVKEQYIREIEDLFIKAIKLSKVSSLSLSDLNEILKTIYKLEEGEE